MATHSGAITSSDAQYKQAFASKLLVEGVVKNDVFQALSKYGCINRNDALENNGGGTVTLYDRLRLDGVGIRGDGDFYSGAAQAETNSRTLNIAKVSYPLTWNIRGSQNQQYAAFDLSEGVEQAMSDWQRTGIAVSLLNQAGGMNATSITQVSMSSSTAFTGSNLLTVTGNNSATAPTYWYEANLGGAITTDSGVNSGNTLSIRDFQLAEQIIRTQQVGRPTWQQLVGKDASALVFVSDEGVAQLMNEATTLGQGQQLSQIINSQLAGGEKIGALNTFMIPGLSFKFIKVPESLMPRGVTTSGTTETANTRRCVIVGANALDLSFGAGFSAGNGSEPLPGVNVEIDTTYKPLNKQAYGNASVLYGAKKVVSTGSGSFASTGYDLSTYVITHYSAR